jgi:hypothetical protein
MTATRRSYSSIKNVPVINFDAEFPMNRGSFVKSSSTSINERQMAGAW